MKTASRIIDKTGEMNLMTQMALVTMGTLGILAGVVYGIIMGIEGNAVGIANSALVLLGGIAAIALVTFHRWGLWVWLAACIVSPVLNIAAGGKVVTHISTAITLIIIMLGLLKLKKYGASAYALLD